MKTAILILFAPLLLWLGYTQPLWHLILMAGLGALGAGVWRASRARFER